MKKNFLFRTYFVLLLFIYNSLTAQNIFPSNGRAGIYTTSPAASLQVRGGARIGTTANYVNIDSATGNLSFAGTSAYRVAGNKYAFQYSGNTNYGLFFNSTNVQYEFRNGSAVPVFSINANTGNSVINGTLKVGAYTLPATDGINGQVLKTNGAGVLTWNNDNGGAGSGWSLMGNAGTNATTNFIGTTDAQSLIFKVNNQRAGFIDYSTCCSGTRNTSFGQIALNSLTTGADNTATGYGVLYTNTTGNQNVGYGKYALFNNNADNNTALGFNTMFFNTSGTGNTATGAVALQNNTTGGYNTATGMNVLASNINGSYNTGSGLNALENNIDGINNTATGAAALQSNTSGINNSAHGMYSLYLNTTGRQNTANGYAALYSNINGNYNTATGSAALNNNTADNNTATGAYAMYLNTQGYNNTATGGNALYSNTTGTDNTAYGYNALRAYNGSAIGQISYNTAIGAHAMEGNIDNNICSASTAVGSYALYNISTDNLIRGIVRGNTAIGYSSMYYTNTGSENTAVGNYALFNNIIGYNNTAIGSGADVTDYYLVNTTAIGAGALTTADDQVRIGDYSVTSIGGYTNWTNISDGRIKKNIKQNVPGLKFINKLQPITYNLDLTAADKITQRPEIKDKNGKTIQSSQSETDSRKIKEQILYTGFIAQDVEKAAKSLNYDFSGVDPAKNAKDLYGLRYAEFVVPLVKAVQELSKMNDDKDSLIIQQEKKINDLEARFTKIETMLGSTTKNFSTNISSALLEQNIPNPFTNTTSINYTLPEKFTSAQIVIIDKNGKTLRTINVSGSGKSSLKVDAATLASGAYSYSLIVNGKLIGTKEMILAK